MSHSFPGEPELPLLGRVWRKLQVQIEFEQCHLLACCNTDLKGRIVLLDKTSELFLWSYLYNEGEITYNQVKPI